MLMRDSLTRDGLTSVLGTGVSPDCWNSSTSGGNSVEQTFIGLAKSSDTMLTTNSRVATMLFKVSFLFPSLPRIIGEKQTTGGLALTPVKKLNGARFRMPSGLMLETKAIGRGTMAPIMSL